MDAFNKRAYPHSLNDMIGARSTVVFHIQAFYTGKNAFIRGVDFESRWTYSPNTQIHTLQTHFSFCGNIIFRICFFIRMYSSQKYAMSSMRQWIKLWSRHFIEWYFSRSCPTNKKCGPAIHSIEQQMKLEWKSPSTCYIQHTPKATYIIFFAIFAFHLHFSQIATLWTGEKWNKKDSQKKKERGVYTREMKAINYCHNQNTFTIF